MKTLAGEGDAIHIRGIVKTSTLVLVLFAIGFAPVPSFAADPQPRPSASPAPVRETPEAKWDHFYIGASSADLKVFFGGDDGTTVQFGAVAGYLISPHHQVGLGYVHDYTSITAAGKNSRNHYSAHYRFYVSRESTTSIFTQATLGIYKYQTPVTTTDAPFAYSLDLGKNFQLFDDSSFVFAPTFGFEKIDGRKLFYRFVPVAFGFYF